MNLTRIATATVRIGKSQVGLGDSSGCSPAAGDDLEPTGSDCSNSSVVPLIFLNIFIFASNHEHSIPCVFVPEAGFT